MSMTKGFSNVFRIPELRKKILITLGLVAVCRLVSHIPTPGVDWTVLASIVEKAKSQGGFLSMLDMFTGGALGQCSIGVLSIWPYISAQIVIQLLSSVIPSLEKMKKEGESGRQQIQQITRYLTIGLCVVQSWSLASAISSQEMMAMMGIAQPIVLNPGLSFNLMMVLCVTTASLFVMWVADQITTFGIGNGGSLIIMINITSRLPQALIEVWDRYFGATRSHGYMELVILLGFFLLVVMATVMLVQGVRKVAIHSTRRSVGGGATFGMQQTFMPLRVNYTGVMPIIFAQPLIQIPFSIVAKFTKSGSFMHTLAVDLTSEQSGLYIVLYSILILFFTFFWVATQFNAIDISENLKKDGSYVPGIRPGRETAVYLDNMMTKITLIGGVGLLLVAIIPTLLMGVLGIPHSIASFFGGTSLLIIVGVALDTLRVMESHLLVRKYEGFLSHGSLRGRGGR